MPSSSLSYCRAIVIADRRSAWAVLLFLTEVTERRTSSNQTAADAFPSPPPCRPYLIRMLDLVGSPCSISDFFSAKIFLMVLASWTSRASKTSLSSLSQQQARESQSRTHLEHLRAGLIVRLGIFNQQVHVLRHGADAGVVAQLEGEHASESFMSETVESICDVAFKKDKPGSFVR